MACIIMVQAIAQTMSVLFLPRGRRSKILQELFGKLVDGSRRRFFRAQLFYFIMQALENVRLAAHQLRADNTTATAHDRITLEIGLLQQSERFNPFWKTRVSQEGRLTLGHSIAHEDDFFVRQDPPD